MVEERRFQDNDKCFEEEEEERPTVGAWDFIRTPIDWFKMLAKETHWSFVYGAIVTYGINQGLGGSLGRVGTEYYMKDVQKVQPSESQIYSGVASIPWMVKPIWGILTDVIPIFGFRRRPYFILAGFVGIFAMLFLSLHKKLHIFLAVLSLTAGSVGMAIADVTVDACVAYNSNQRPFIAADLQSLCTLSSATGALIGFSFSGILVHLIGPNGVYGLLAVPYVLVLSIGILLSEPRIHNFSYSQVGEMFHDATKSMWMTLTTPAVWRPCLYMYLSLALNADVYEGMFYWYTDSEGGPHFSQEFVGYIFSIGSIGALLGAIFYQYILKDYEFRTICFWTQLIFGLSGMLDLIFVLRLNLKLGISDYFFAVIDECVFQLIGKLRWMPLLVLSAKLCPSGIEGTFFALLMSIDNTGRFTSSWFGGVLLHLLNITRTKFDNLWMAISFRMLLRLGTLAFLFLLPKRDPNTDILSTEVLIPEEDIELPEEGTDVELIHLVNSVDR